MSLVATAVDIEIKSVNIHWNWPIVGTIVVAIISVWLVILFIRNR